MPDPDLGSLKAGLFNSIQPKGVVTLLSASHGQGGEAREA